MIPRVLLLLAMTAALTACTTAAPDPFLTASVSASAPAIATEVSPDFAAARLPATAGPVRLVRQTVREDALEQTVLYASPTDIAGENMLTVRAGTGSGFLRPPTRAEIQAEMRAALPGISMAIQPVLAENAQGTFGYATGRFGASGACLYGWQLIGPKATGSPLSLTGNGALRQQIRLRFCQSGATEESLVGLMRGLVAKPVTKDTLAMLRFAGGSGSSAIALPAGLPQTSARPVVRIRKAEPIAADEEPVSLPISRHGAVPVQQAAISSAAEVPLPTGEDSSVSKSPQKTIAKAALVPMPEMASSN